MVSVKHQPHYSLISLQPNRSADWVHNKWLMAGMAGVALIIATMWAFFGIWIVFPFAGIEVGLLCYLLYRVSHNTYRTQTLSFEKDYVHIQSNQKSSPTVTLSRRDTHLEMSESPRDWYLPQLALVTPEHSIRVGEFLNQADRHRLYEEIKNIGIPAWRHHWWKH